MSTEDLMKPRYKVIAHYPGAGCKVGDIFIQHDWGNGNYSYLTNTKSPLEGKSMNKENMENYPHLFKKLEWWEDRKESDMPEYLKEGGNVYKNEKDFTYRPTGITLINNRCVNFRYLLPATKEEYENQKQ